MTKIPPTKLKPGLRRRSETQTKPSPARFNQFYEQCYTIVAATLTYAIHDMELAEKATDRAMVEAYDQWAQVELNPNPVPYLYRSARKFAADNCRQSRFRLGSRRSTPPPYSDPALQSMLLQLDPETRSVTACALVGNWPTDDIAVAHNLTPAEVETRLPEVLDHLVDSAEASRLLRADAQSLSMVGAGPGAIPSFSGAQARKKNLTYIGAVLATAALVISGVYLAWPGAGSTSNEDDGGQLFDVSTIGDSPVEFAWTSGDADLSLVRSSVASSDGFWYAISTAPPGQGFGIDQWEPKSLYRSSDGVSWTYVPSDSDSWITNLSASQGVLYAVGTAPGNENSIVRIGRSTDSGKTWDLHEFLSAASPPDLAAVSRYAEADLDVGAVNGITLAALTTTYYLDDEALIDNTGRNQSTFPTAEGIAGVDGYEFQYCFEAAYPTYGQISPGSLPTDVPECADISTEITPWSEFGLESLDDLITREYFISSDGENWETVTPTGIPALDGYTQLRNIQTTDSGFLLSSFSPFTHYGGLSHAAATSVDGKSWVEVPLPSRSLASLSAMGDTLIGVSTAPVDGQSSVSVFSSVDHGANWVNTDLTGLLPDSATKNFSIVSASSGPLGFGFVLASFDSLDEREHSTNFVFTADGESWSVTPLHDASGNPEPMDPYSTSLVITDDKVAISSVTHNQLSNRPVSRLLVGSPQSK